jgi:hypothetical protein
MVPHQDAGHGEKVREDDPDPDPGPSASSGGSGTSASSRTARTAASRRCCCRSRRPRSARIYDRGEDETVAAPLAAYLALLHVAGPMAGGPTGARGRRLLAVAEAVANLLRIMLLLVRRETGRESG